MAMSKNKAIWVTGLFVTGLLALFLGRRVLEGFAPASFLTWLGLVLVVGATVLRGILAAAAPGKLRDVERLLLVCQVGAALALGLFGLGTDAGTRLLGITEPKSVERWQTIILVLWPILMAIALLPFFMIQLATSFGGRWQRSEGKADGGTRAVPPDAGVELHKVRELAGSGLTIALATAFLMVTCNVAEQRDVRKDVSYFKTSAPGASTIAMAKSLNEPLTVYLFFDEVSEVADQAEAYFKDLAAAAGDKVVVERSDRLVAPALVKDLKVAVDGTIVLKRGDKNEKITLKTDLAAARREDLRELDSKVQKALMKVLRAKRVAYFSVGHGELNNPQSASSDKPRDPDAKSSIMKRLMAALNYEVKDWDGFGKPVPDDASILFVLSPASAFSPEELAAIDDYLGRGGSLLLALPGGEPFDLGPLSGRLGIAFDPTAVATDNPQEHAVRRRNLSDNLLLVTDQFSSHASVTGLSRAGGGAKVVVPDTGHLVDAPFTRPSDTLKRTYVVRSTATSWADANGNFVNDEGEKRDRQNLIAAIEDPAAKPAKAGEGTPSDGMRAVVFAGATVFWDGMLVRSIGANQELIEDVVRWLGGEEEFAGETVSEKDVAIEHTKSEDVKWFYASLVGAPLLVLALGLGSLSWRRRRAQRRRS
jgi:hypothetical protein